MNNLENNLETRLNSGDLTNIIIENNLQAYILRDVAKLDNSLILYYEQGNKSYRNCPKCNSENTFKILNLTDGALYCSKCYPKGSGKHDFIGAVMWGRSLDNPAQAAALIAQYLNRKGLLTPETVEKLTETKRANAQKWGELSQRIDAGTTDARRIATLERRLEILEEREAQKNALDVWGNDRQFYDNRFPMDATPPQIQEILYALGIKYGSPYGATLAALLAATSGFLGANKGIIYRNPKQNTGSADVFRPNIHAALVGESGTGKSQITAFALAPIRQISTDENRFYNNLKRDKGAIIKELNALELIDEKEKTDDQKNRAEYLKIVVSFLEEGKAAYWGTLASVEGVYNQLYSNELRAKLENEKPNGFILHQEATALFLAGETLREARETAVLYSRLNALGDGLNDVGKALNRKGNGEADIFGASYLLEIHPENLTAIKNKHLRANGFLNRFIYAFCPRGGAENKGYDVTNAEKIWRQIVDFIRNFQGGKFYIGYGDALETFSRKLEEQAKEADRNGDAPKAAFLEKAYNIVNQTALALHLWKLATNDGETSQDETTVFDGVTVPQWSIIPLETFLDASKLVEYYIATRSNVWGICLETMKPENATRSETASIPDKIRAVYEYAIENGLPFDLIAKGDALGRALTITELRTGANHYRTSANQKAVEQDLIDRALMFIEAGKRQPRRRFFLPESLTLEELRRWKDENDGDAEE